jgi:phosphoribosyl 1,2-cyclic phosphate phosphodiesterase
MRLTFLGTGTSYGVPFVGCDCTVCRSTDPRNKRLRCSILVTGDRCEEAGDVCERTLILVDTTPDVRQQLLRAHVSYISAILWTHDHNDHIIGLDDLRPLSDRQGYIHGWGNEPTIHRLKSVFDYAFVQDRERGGFPRLTDRIAVPYETFSIGDVQVMPIPIMHGQREIFAYRFECNGRVLVYATDCSGIPEASWAPMSGADVLVLDALHEKPHPTHFNIEQACEATEKLKPGRAFFTHTTHNVDYATVNSNLPPNIEIAYDGLSLEV